MSSPRAVDFHFDVFAARRTLDARHAVRQDFEIVCRQRTWLLRRSQWRQQKQQARAIHSTSTGTVRACPLSRSFTCSFQRPRKSLNASGSGFDAFPCAAMMLPE